MSNYLPAHIPPQLEQQQGSRAREEGRKGGREEGRKGGRRKGGRSRESQQKFLKAAHSLLIEAKKLTKQTN